MNRARALRGLAIAGLLAACGPAVAPAPALPPSPVPVAVPPPPADAAPAGDSPFEVGRVGKYVGYSGPLLAEGLQALLRVDDPSVTVLLIRSAGGDIGIGMDFGEWVWTRKLAVLIDQYCLSSCANYVFTAATKRSFRPGAVVAWHGSALQADFPARLKRAMDEHDAGPDERAGQWNMLEALRARQNAFFARIGVDECITRIGNTRFGARGLFTMSAADMARFHVKEIEAAPERLEDVDAGFRERMDARGGLMFVRLPPSSATPVGCD